MLGKTLDQLQTAMALTLHPYAKRPLLAVGLTPTTSMGGAALRLRGLLRPYTSSPQPWPPTLAGAGAGRP